MPRRLVVLRHAKSDWNSGTQGDHDRPLSARGVRTAPRVGERILTLGWSPQVVLHSDAQRTTETWALMADRFPHAQSRSERALYLADPLQILALLGRLPDEAEAVMVIGHNPGLSEAVEWLTGEPIDLRTADAALLTGPAAGWSDAVSTRGWALTARVVARELEAPTP